MKQRMIPVIAGGVSVVMLLAWWFLMWTPAGTDIDVADKKFNAASSQVSSLSVQVTRLEATEAQMPQMQSRLQTLGAAVPDSPDMSEFLIAVNDAAVQSGLEFHTVTAEEPGPSVAGMSQVSIQITGVGGYFQTLDFINRLQSTHRIMVIDNIATAGFPSEGDDPFAGPPDLNVTIGGRLFVASGLSTAGA